MSDLKLSIGIVGAGIIGLTIARELNQRGARVTVIDVSRTMAIASTAAGGMLSAVAETMDEAPGLAELCFASRDLWPSLASQLARDTGIDPGFRREGTVLLARTEPEQAKLVALVEGEPDETIWWPSDELKRNEPALAAEIVGGVFVAGDGQVDARQVMSALKADCQRRQVTFVEVPGGAQRLLDIGGRICGVEAGGALFRFDLVLVAAGVWTSEVLAATGLDVSGVAVTPVRGQMIALQQSNSIALTQRVLRAGDTYLIPRRGGRIVVGATSADKGLDFRVNTAETDALFDRARSILPDLQRDWLEDVWVGFRPKPNGPIPLLGQELAPGLKIVSGHYRNGVLLAPITAKRVAETICGGLAAPEFDHTLTNNSH